MDESATLGGFARDVREFWFLLAIDKSVVSSRKYAPVLLDLLPIKVILMHKYPRVFSKITLLPNFINI